MGSVRTAAVLATARSSDHRAVASIGQDLVGDILIDTTEVSLELPWRSLPERRRKSCDAENRCVKEDHVHIVYDVYMSASAPLGRPISVRLPEDLRGRVEALAKATRRSQGDVVREVLERDLPKLEWEQRIVARAADLRSGRLRAVSLSDVERELGLSDVPVDASILDEIE